MARSVARCAPRSDITSCFREQSSCADAGALVGLQLIRRNYAPSWSNDHLVSCPCALAAYKRLHAAGW